MRWRDTRQRTSQIQPIVTAAATVKLMMPNSGVKPGTSFKALCESLAGQPVSFAIQNSQTRAASVVSAITENQSMALIAPRFMVGRPNAAIRASGGSSFSKSPFSGVGSHRITAVSAPRKVSGRTMCSMCCWRRQAQIAQPANGQAGQKNQTPTRKKALIEVQPGRASCSTFQPTQAGTGDWP